MFVDFRPGSRPPGSRRPVSRHRCSGAQQLPSSNPLRSRPAPPASLESSPRSSKITEASKRSEFDKFEHQFFHILHLRLAVKSSHHFQLLAPQNATITGTVPSAPARQFHKFLRSQLWAMVVALAMLKTTWKVESQRSRCVKKKEEERSE